MLSVCVFAPSNCNPFYKIYFTPSKLAKKRQFILPPKSKQCYFFVFTFFDQIPLTVSNLPLTEITRHSVQLILLQPLFFLHTNDIISKITYNRTCLGHFFCLLSFSSKFPPKGACVRDTLATGAVSLPDAFDPGPAPPVCPLTHSAALFPNAGCRGKGLRGTIIDQN